MRHLEQLQVDVRRWIQKEGYKSHHLKTTNCGEILFSQSGDKWRYLPYRWVGYVQWTTPPPVLRVEQSTLTSHPVRNVRLKGHSGKYGDGR
ncbi:hypothetical protein TNCV_1312721 [Trichonephila clavipes]|nr:hypothetical protein TNCV_1312721 [Trichonephila clavipes]